MDWTVERCNLYDMGAGAKSAVYDFLVITECWLLTYHASWPTLFLRLNF